MLKAETRVGQWVQPVVVIWGAFPQRVAEQDGVVYLHGDAVQQWLREQRVRLQPEHVARLAAGLTKALRTA